MRLERLVLVTAAVMFILTFPVQAAGVLGGKVIALDPGHGGETSGAVSETGIVEKDMNNVLTIKIAGILKSMGAEVIYTKNPNVDEYISLEDRVGIANSKGADLFVSIHHDGSYSAGANGVSAHYSSYRVNLDLDNLYVYVDGIKYKYIKEVDKNVYFEDGSTVRCEPLKKENVICIDETPRIAVKKSENLAKMLVESLSRLGLANRGTRDHNLQVTRYTNMPSVLVECGFMTNSSDMNIIASPQMQDKTAEAIAYTIRDYFIAHGEDKPLTGVYRLSGLDRYMTSIKISENGWKESKYVLIATGEDFPDALCASPIAKKYNAPILLTKNDKLSAELENEIKRLKVQDAIIVGGEGAVSKSIEDRLVNIGIKCSRIWGKDRYETSLEAAKMLGKVDEVFITTGDIFPDALSAASYAAFRGIPIILTMKESISNDVIQHMKKNSISRTYVIGGEGAVGPVVLSSIVSAERIYGRDRYETNIALIDRFKDKFNTKRVYLATGEDFPDALSGSALASMTESPMLLVGVTNKEGIYNYIIKNKEKISERYVLGGSGAIPQSMLYELFK